MAGALSLLPFKGGVPRQIEGENMRIALSIVGAVLLFFGGVWILQGVNVLPGSFMSGQMRWAVRGGILAITGVALLLWANRKRQRAV
jgi:drug/metabolite transporter superfamily protein YnfA